MVPVLPKRVRVVARVKMIGMVEEAIKALGKSSGVSSSEVMRYVSKKYNLEPPKFLYRLLDALRTAERMGFIKQLENRKYALAGDTNKLCGTRGRRHKRSACRKKAKKRCGSKRRRKSKCKKKRKSKCSRKRKSKCRSRHRRRKSCKRRRRRSSKCKSKRRRKRSCRPKRCTDEEQDQILASLTDELSAPVSSNNMPVNL